MTEWWWPLAQLGMGLVVGLMFMTADKVLFSHWYKTYLDLHQAVVMTRSLLFLLVYWPLTIFVLSSAGLLIGQGMVLGIGLVLALEMWQKYRDLEAFKSYFQIPPSSCLTQSEVTYLTFGWSGLWLVALVLVLL